MKYLVRFFVVTFLMLASTYAYAEQKIVYIDMKIVLNQSKAGKEAESVQAEGAKVVEGVQSSAVDRRDAAVQLVIDSLMSN